MSKKKIVIIGAGDFGREVAYTIERINESLALGDKWDIYGFIDDDIEIQGKIIDDYPVIGAIDWLNQHKEKIYAVCSLGTGAIRKKVIDKISTTFLHVLYTSLLIIKYQLIFVLLHLQIHLKLLQSHASDSLLIFHLHLYEDS